MEYEKEFTKALQTYLSNMEKEQSQYYKSPEVLKEAKEKVNLLPSNSMEWGSDAPFLLVQRQKAFREGFMRGAKWAFKRGNLN